MTLGAESSQADIKRYEDMLGADPASFCFAPLAELYRKAGLIDDAISTARKGIELHPDYVGGYLALGRACFDKGEHKESREALERVVKATPDNLVAQKLLGRIYEDIGETSLVRKTLETILALNPDDRETRAALDELDLRGKSFDLESDVFGDDVPVVEEAAELFDDDEFLLEEVEIIEELDDEIFEEEPAAITPQLFDEPQINNESGSEPLSTATIAELYIKQGFLKKALKIYRDLLNANPGNEALRQSIVALKHRIDEDEASARENAFTSKMPFGDEFAEVARENDMAAGTEAADSGSPADVVTRLEEWLDTIGRVRQCRSGIR